MHRGHSISLVGAAKEVGIDIRSKPSPLQSAILSVYLVAKNFGSRVNLSIDRGKIKIKYNDIENSENYTVVPHGFDLDEEFTHRKSITYLNHNQEIDEVITIIGFGKEAQVYLVRTIDDELVVVKLFRMYSSIAKRIRDGTYKTNARNVPTLMAKQEAYFIKTLQNTGFVPKLLRRTDNYVMMTPIFHNNRSDLALPLSMVDLNQYGSPVDYCFETLNYLLSLFVDYHLIHSDYSPQNLLFDGIKIWVIDCSQAIRVNFNTFVDTPKRLKIDTALKLLIRDIDGLLSHFTRKYQLHFDRAQIIYQFIEEIPEYSLTRSILHWYKMDLINSSNYDTIRIVGTTLSNQ